MSRAEGEAIRNPGEEYRCISIILQTSCRIKINKMQIFHDNQELDHVTYLFLRGAQGWDKDNQDVLPENAGREHHQGSDCGAAGHDSLSKAGRW